MKLNLFVKVVVALLLVMNLMSCRNNYKNTPFSESALNDIQSFELEDGFQIELVASEPYVFDPVDMMIDEFGKMYVVEMPGVPFDKSGTGKIVVLEDTDGDGNMDKRTVFVDSLSLPTGVMKWKKGIIVTDPPNVFYFEDTDNDGIADLKRTLLTNFDTSNLEANVNNPEYGIDNWVYLADLPIRTAPGGIYFPEDTSIAGINENTMRFRPEERVMEPISGWTQFGHTFDPYGRYLMVNNSNHIYQNVIDAKYLNRNPDMVVSGATETLSRHNKVFPVTVNPEYQMLTNVGVFTSACGIVSYQGGIFPNAYNDNVTFVCEPASNIVHVDKLEPTGPTFIANRMSEETEFLASKDPYSRIVNLYIGPDGALYLVDMYRQVIEGPEFMAQEVLDTVDLYNGTKKGRIYRITPKGTSRPDWTQGLDLGNRTSAELVNELANKNIWWRLNAQRILVDRQDGDAVPNLVEMAGNKESPLGRLHALWTLEGMKSLGGHTISTAMKDSDPGIRENAIKLAELHLKEKPTLLTSLMEMKDDPDSRVKFQLLLTLGEKHSAEVNKLREKLLFDQIANPWVQIAALSAGSDDAIPLLNSLISNFKQDNDAYVSLIQRLGAIVGKSQPTEIIDNFIGRAFASSGEIKWTIAVLNGINQGLQNRSVKPSGIEKNRPLLINNILENKDIEIRKSALNLLRTIGVSGSNEYSLATKKAIEEINSPQILDEEKVVAIEFLSLSLNSGQIPLLKSLITPKESPRIQVAAINSLAQNPGTEITDYLLSQWPALSPGAKEASINLTLVNDERTALLLDAVKSNLINIGEFSWTQSVRLRSLGNMELRMRARELFSKKDDKLAGIIADYKTALRLKGRAAEGKRIYQVQCSMCHQIEGKGGRAYGPDLGTVHAWAPADIMTNIIDPNRTIALGYDTWEVITNSGRTIQGVIREETPTSIKISNVNGDDETIARQDIQSLSALKISAMPEGLEEKIDKQQMADLLAFLKEGDDE